MIPTQVCGKRKLVMIPTPVCNEMYTWIATQLPESAAIFIQNLKYKGIETSALLRMNVNHFKRLGLNESCANRLHKALHSKSLPSRITTQDKAPSHALQSPCDTVLSTLRPFTTVAVIGTAGRFNAGGKMSQALFRHMCEKAETMITQYFGLCREHVRLVSGGAAWADHVAVNLFMDNKFNALQLYLPCKWVSSPAAHEDNGSSNWKRNPGSSANRYHRRFSATLGVNTLEQIQQAKERGAVVVEGTKGFHARNTHVAASDYMIAFTWADGPNPGPGGTLDTWNKCQSRHKVHVSL